MIKFGREVCGYLEAATTREWLETNGLGGYASSTVCNINTRRYHGLLVAALNPPTSRFVLLSKLEETLVIGTERFELSSNKYRDVVHPAGYQHLTEFRLDPFPTFTYWVAGVEIEKTVLMLHGQNSTVIQYQLLGRDEHTHRSRPLPEGECYLEVRPLIAFRDYHSLTRENDALNPHLRVENSSVIVAPYAGLPALHFAHDADELDPDGFWFRGFEYAAERARGFDVEEDLFSPFVLRFNASNRATRSVIASTEGHDIKNVNSYRQNEAARRRTVFAAAPRAKVSSAETDNEFLRTLVHAADQFVVKRGDHKTVIAGYYWFSDWGRDTMIALPGLTLMTGRADVARDVLIEFAHHVNQGMIPNRFPDEGEQPEYNTIDATLWFFEAVRAYLEHTRDAEFVREHLYDKLSDIIAWHVHGTRHRIRVDEADGLLAGGEAGVQLTWMDAKVGDFVVTPRVGKPVEVQSLWYNALRVMESFARSFDDATCEQRYGQMAARVYRSFNHEFWNESAGCLFDVVDGDTRDASIRPNQIFAVSLRHSMLSPERAKRVVEIVRRELLTTHGLRSLSPRDPRYRGTYAGDVWARDTAYHQGTVWAWLLGPFVTAYVKVNNHSPESLQQVREWLEVARLHLREAGVGSVSEIFDGDAPHTARGCVAQAWSVAEMLRIYVEHDVEVNQAETRHAAERTASYSAQTGSRVL